LVEFNHPCGVQLGARENVTFDHIGERAITGDDSEENYRPICKACDKIKTNGFPATTAGSSKGKIAKVRRITKDQEAFRQRLLAKDSGEPKPPSKWKSRKFETKGKSRWNRAIT
jgi:hypothetical protein